MKIQRRIMFIWGINPLCTCMQYMDEFVSFANPTVYPFVGNLTANFRSSNYWASKQIHKRFLHLNLLFLSHVHLQRYILFFLWWLIFDKEIFKPIDDWENVRDIFKYWTPLAKSSGKIKRNFLFKIEL